MAKRLLDKLFHDYKHGAARRGIEFSLSRKFFNEIVFKNCFYCGRAPYQLYSSGYDKITRTGVDRKEDDIGYIESNCVPCCKECNYKKRNKPFLTFLKGVSGG